MKFKAKFKKFPKVAWDKLNLGLINNAIAGDMAGKIQERIRGSKVTPPLATETQERKKRFKSVPLMETGLLVRNISNHLTAKKNTAEVYIKDKKYKQENKKQTVGRRKRTGTFSHLATTNEIAVIHTKGLGRNLPKREFFYMNENDLQKSTDRRMKEGINGAMKRAGIIK